MIGNWTAQQWQATEITSCRTIYLLIRLFPSDGMKVVEFDPQSTFLCLLTGLCGGQCFIYIGSSDGKASACNVGDLCLIPGSGKSPGEENGNPLQYSCVENAKDREAWRATVYRVVKSRTWLSNFPFTSSLQIYMCVCVWNEALWNDLEPYWIIQSNIQ